MTDILDNPLETVEKNSIHMLKASAFYPGLFLIQLMILVMGESLWGIDKWVSITYIALGLGMAYALSYKITDIENFPIKYDPLSHNTKLGRRTVVIQASYYLFSFVITWTAMLVAVYYGLIVNQEIMVGQATGLFIMNVCLVSPTETMVFHGMIPDRLKKYFKGYRHQRMIYYGISQGIFAIFHFAVQQGNIYTLGTTMVFGCIFLYIAENYGLASAMGAHTAWNLVVLGILSGGLIYG
jgi:membrane protease YdiL (CAAX protease family)